jgi:hypothetical protein
MDENELKALMDRIKQEDPDLYAISQNESSGGINLDHPIASKGLNKGHQAGGPWGMMPITAKEVVGRSSEFKEQYPDVSEMEPQDLTNLLNTDPALAYALAKSEYQRRLNRMGGDKEKAAHSWMHGVSGTLKSNPEDIKSSDYVQKFLRNLQIKN